MYSRVNYSSAAELVIEALDKENIKVSDEFNKKFLELLSKVCNYEEEEIKVRPNIMVAFKIHSILQQVPQIKTIEINKGNKDGSEMMKILKAIIPFCNSGWIVYINVEDEYIEYGILRSFGGIYSVALTEQLFEKNNDLGGDNRDESEECSGLIYFSVIGCSEIIMHSLKDKTKIIDMRFIGVDEASNYDDGIKSLANDMTKALTGSMKRDIKQSMLNLLRLTFQKVHGTICIIVKHDVNVKKLNIFKKGEEYCFDGLVLQSTIDIASLASETIRDKSSESSEKYYMISGLLLQMMNVDGACIIDDIGRILAYNVFVALDGNGAQGGARKRAAQTILNKNDENIIGVYFQSQDGNSFYKRGGQSNV
ncbi:hypothetical protein [Clostridium sp.]|uniref:hypothetical protein n=1 Tax=Clostridium sp. TaxID=1506 RepID=UPI002FDCF077